MGFLTEKLRILSKISSLISNSMLTTEYFHKTISKSCSTLKSMDLNGMESSLSFVNKLERAVHDPL